MQLKVREWGSNLTWYFCEIHEMKHPFQSHESGRRCSLVNCAKIHFRLAFLSMHSFVKEKIEEVVPPGWVWLANRGGVRSSPGHVPSEEIWRMWWHWNLSLYFCFLIRAQPWASNGHSQCWLGESSSSLSSTDYNLLQYSPWRLKHKYRWSCCVAHRTASNSTTKYPKKHGMLWLVFFTRHILSMRHTKLVVIAACAPKWS